MSLSGGGTVNNPCSGPGLACGSGSGHIMGQSLLHRCVN